MAKSRKYEIGVGALLVVSAVVLSYMAIQVGAFRDLGPRLEVEVLIPDAAGLQEGSAVSLAGIEVGKIKSFSLENGQALAQLRLMNDLALTTHAEVRVRQRSVLGEKYVEIIPKEGGEPLVGHRRLAPAPPQFEIDEMLAKMAPLLEFANTPSVRPALEGLAKKLEEDPELLARMLDRMDLFLKHAASASEKGDRLLGQSEGTLHAADKTLESTGSLVRMLQARANEAGPVLARTDRVLSTVEDLSSEWPEWMAEIRSTTGTVGGLVTTLDENKGKLEIILDNLTEFDKWELRRLLREEGILIRLRPAEVAPVGEARYRPEGQVRPKK